MKKILIINGHPNPESYNYALAKAYKKGALSNNAEIRQIAITKLDFGKPFLTGFTKDQSISKDILSAQEDIKWADHLVWIYPTWWSTMPAMMKSFIEQTFLPDFAFKYKKNNKHVKWDKYLENKSARLISTMDTPPLIYKLFVKDPGYKTMKDIMNFCGIKPVRRTYFGSVKTSDETKRKQWLKKVEEMGKNLQ